MYAEKKPKMFLIVGLGIIVLAGGIFLIGKKLYQKKEVSQVKNDQKDELERHLQQLKNQSQKRKLTQLKNKN